MSVEHKTISEMRQWCADTFGPKGKRWISIWEGVIDDSNKTWNNCYCEYVQSDTLNQNFIFVFLNKDDAMLFRLTWG